MSRYDYSWADAADLPEILSFVQKQYGEGSVQALPGRLEWLFGENPHGLHISLCRADGEIAAVCGYLPRSVALGGETRLAGFGVDFYVAPEHRRRGIGRRFLEMRRERFDLSLSTGQSEAMSSLYREIHAVDLGSFQSGVFYNAPPKWGTPRAVFRGWLAWLQKMTHCSHRVVKVVPCAVSDALDRIESLPCADAMTRSWFRWRYDAAVYPDYGFLVAMIGRRVIGVIVCRTHDDEQVLVDIYAEPKHRNHVLRAAAIHSNRKSTTMYFYGDGMRMDLRKAGFWVRPWGARLFVVPGRELDALDLTPAMINLTAGVGDADLIRKPDPAPDGSRAGVS